jgi:hypothetical protein
LLIHGGSLTGFLYEGFLARFTGFFHEVPDEVHGLPSLKALERTSVMKLRESREEPPRRTPVNP